DSDEGAAAAEIVVAGEFCEIPAGSGVNRDHAVAFERLAERDRGGCSRGGEAEPHGAASLGGALESAGEGWIGRIVRGEDVGEGGAAEARDEGGVGAVVIRRRRRRLA